MLVHTTCRGWRNCFNDERWLGASPDGSSLIFLPQSYSFPLVNFYIVANQSSLRNTSVHLLSKRVENSLWLVQSHLVWSGQVWLWYCSCSIYCSRKGSTWEKQTHTSPLGTLHTYPGREFQETSKNFQSSPDLLMTTHETAVKQGNKPYIRAYYKLFISWLNSQIIISSKGNENFRWGCLSGSF